MKGGLVAAALSLCCVLDIANAFHSSLSSGRQTIGRIRRQQEARKLAKRDTDPELLYPTHNFTIPVDHFHNESQYEPHSNATYENRYWFDATYYKPGGPVIILQSGEADASERLVYLQKGILHDLAKATNGIGVVFEHRYYGTSFPTPDLTPENLRFLTTAQALADEAYFAQNIQFPGLEKYGDLTSKSVPYLNYGGSYSGAISAFLRVQYPDIFWGTISSSGVTKAIYDYWQYYEPIVTYAPQDCVAVQKTLINVVDNILIGKNSSNLSAELKSTFGFPNVTYDDDFANILGFGVGNWQSLNWDPAVSSPEFYNYCDNITSTQVLYPATESVRSDAAYLIGQGGYSANTSLTTQMLNMIGYYNLTEASTCGKTQDECFGTHNYTTYQDYSLSNWNSLSWPYQYCTEWGYLQTGSGVPSDQLPIISRLLTLEYESIVCRAAFNITTPPDTESVNKYGGYNISYPRLAIIDGEWDPWRPATPHAFGYGAVNRPSTPSQPFLLISEAVHHWDENGLFFNQTTFDLPPPAVAETQSTEVIFATEWMQEWDMRKVKTQWKRQDVVRHA
ncbi:hypothetical protein EJ03DRAFT_292874 [Teratosphaeria nubilosa]|uniref:Peptidase S28 n=1 Tax=Teratosphaeria nubilosa TaxID=161662 RepID=A0A6G1L972_9PEZI|nr:hypothetical protein EJ03DRAFT_292874 [Teratosphaeria nubilosa]